jgi:hypothetical protein
MTTPGVNAKIKKTGSSGEIPITCNGETFFITLEFKSLYGLAFTIPKEQFGKLVFDNSYKTPWITGLLQFRNMSDIQKDSIVGTQAALVLESNPSGYSGQMLKIVVEKQSLKTNCQRVVLIDQLFFVTHIEQAPKNSKIINYYFAHIDVAPLMFTKSFSWSTNNHIISKLAAPSTGESGRIGPIDFAASASADVDFSKPEPWTEAWSGTKVRTSIPFKQAERIVSHLSDDQKQVFVSDAIKNLLNTFCQKEEFDIINHTKWDKSATKVEYTSSQGDRPLDALFYLMSQYVSEDQQDMGLLRLHEGTYSLTSLTNLIKSSGKLNTPSTPFGIQFKENFGGIIEVQTDDIRPKYSKRQADSLWDRHFASQVVRKDKIKEHPKQPKDGAKYIIDHSISSYNFTNGIFNLYNEDGSIGNLKNKFKENMQTGFTDSEKKELNANTDDLTSNNKQIISQTSTGSGDPGGRYLGKTTLQQKILDKSNKITINMTGNLNMTGGKFIGIHMPGRHINPSLPGMWFVLNNTTTLTQNSFQTKLTCSQMDANAG